MEAKEKYIAFCKKEKYLPIFLQPWYLDSVCPKAAWDAVVCERNDKVVGIFPFYKVSKKLFYFITMPPNSRMMGPYIDLNFRGEETYRKIVKEMSRALPKVEFFYQCFHYAITDWLTFYSQKYNGKKLYSYILNDFSDLGKAYSKINRTVRDKDIPTARKILTIKSGISPQLFYDLYAANLEEQNKKLKFDLKAFMTLYDGLIKNNAGKLYFVEDKEHNVHAAGLLMWDHLSSYFFLAADNNKFRYSKALSFLTWQCIEITSKELELDFFDFGGNHIDSADIAYHPFGAVQVPFLNLSRYNSSKFGPFKSMKKRLKKK